MFLSRILTNMCANYIRLQDYRIIPLAAVLHLRLFTEHTHTNTHTFIHILTYTHTNRHSHTLTYTYSYTLTHTFIHNVTYTHTLTHTYTNRFTNMLANISKIPRILGEVCQKTGSKSKYISLILSHNQIQERSRGQKIMNLLSSQFPTFK